MTVCVPWPLKLKQTCSNVFGDVYGILQMAGTIFHRQSSQYSEADLVDWRYDVELDVDRECQVLEFYFSYHCYCFGCCCFAIAVATHHQVLPLCRHQLLLRGHGLQHVSSTEIVW